ncbi:MAG: PQQ-binding-like beta-propeller repeat protein [Pirellulaceae bacterium]|jgi:outer membrane protein assembly factor BamB|nr:PQQ-binding-like beta-propeller repeat protein [Pirellulaceae bacterium]
MRIELNSLALMACLVAAATVSAEDWPRWRGPAGNGHSSDKSGWESGAWPLGEPQWKRRLHAGGSAPIIANGRLYSLGWADEQDHVTCLDAVTGKTIWRQSYACPPYGRHSTGDKGLYSGPSSCPTLDTDSGLLFTLSTDGDLRCWNARRGGELVWRKNLYETYDVGQRPLVGTRRLRDYGYTTAPFLYGDWVIVEVGDDEGNLMAFAKRSGERIWASESRDPAGHTGGMSLIKVDGVPCIAVLTIHNLVVSRLDKGHEGETLAKFPWETDFANSIASPVVHGDTVLLTSEYNQYSICRVRISVDGAKEMWRQPYASGVCTPVVMGKYVYWCWRGVYCFDLATGRPVWRGGSFGDTASLIGAADKRLLLWAGRGDLVLIESADRSPKAYRELSRKRTRMENDVWPHLAAADGRLYCQDRDGNLLCFDLGKR